MIFVTVGNAKQPFPRLISAVERLTATGGFGEANIVIQSGHTPVTDSGLATYETFVRMDRFADLVADAELLICHGGEGTLMHAFQCGKAPVVMPRRKEYGEHVDNHQVELARTLEASGRIAVAMESEDLRDAMDRARRLAGDAAREPVQMIRLVSEAIKALGCDRRPGHSASRTFR